MSGVFKIIHKRLVCLKVFISTNPEEFIFVFNHYQEPDWLEYSYTGTLWIRSMTSAVSRTKMKLIRNVLYMMSTIKF